MKRMSFLNGTAMIFWGRRAEVGNSEEFFDIVREEVQHVTQVFARSLHYGSRKGGQHFWCLVCKHIPITFKHIRSNVEIPVREAVGPYFQILQMLAVYQLFIDTIFDYKF